MSGMGIVDLAEYLDLKPTYLDGTNIGGSSFVAHVAHAAAAIHAGMCEVALVLYGSTAASNAMAIGTGMGGERRDPAASFTSPYGMTTVGSYALVAQLHRQRFGTTAEQLAEIAVTMRHHASLNPAAKMRQPITVDDVLASRMISEPAPPARLLHHQRRRRRRGGHVRGAGARPAEGAGAAARLRRGGRPPGDGRARPLHDRRPPVGPSGRSRWPASATTTSTSA